MIQKRGAFFTGIFIIILPFLGFPVFWKTTFTIFAGVFLIFSSIKIIIPRKPGWRRMHTVRKDKVTPVFVESAPPVYPKNDTIEASFKVAESTPSEIKVEESIPEVIVTPKKPRTRTKKPKAEKTP